MFSEIKLKIRRDFFVDKKYTYEEYIDIGMEHLEHMAMAFEKDMFACIGARTTDQLIIDQDWFPELRIDVYIPHIWMEDGLQFALAGWLYSTFGLRCMIDSYLWYNVDKLTDEYNNSYSNHRKKSNGMDVFDYKCGNRVSNHVMSMLQIASVKMLERAEAVMFLNADEEMYIYENRTLSKRYLPWVYTEMVIADNMKTKPLSEYRRQSSDINAEAGKVSKLNEYISENELEQWEQECEGKDIHPLDVLYKLLNIL